MKNWLLTLLFVCSCIAPISANALNIMTLSKKNTVTFRGVVTSQSVANVEVEMLEMSQKLKSTDVIYLVLDTPGGSVESGMQFIDFVQSLPQKVKTITVFAASMGFHIAENLDERLILPSATLMSHRAAIDGLGGEIPGKLLTELGYVLRTITRVEMTAAQRMKLSLPVYQNLIKDELWMRGSDAVRMRAADRVVSAKCDESFSGTQEIELMSFMGMTLMGKMSNCPLISGVLSYRVDGGEGSSSDYVNFKKLSQIYVSDKVSFVKQSQKSLFGPL